MELVTPANTRKTDRQRRRTGVQTTTPVLKLFNPCGAGTWLVTELDPEDTSVAFGLADLGFGCPEAGSFSLKELEAFKGPFGLGIERDLYFEGKFSLAVYAEAARAAGRIVEYGSELAAAARRRGAATCD